MDYAAAVNEEIKDLFAAGADVIQIDEPYMQARPAKAKQYGVRVLNRALTASLELLRCIYASDTLRSFMNSRRVTRSA